MGGHRKWQETGSQGHTPQRPAHLTSSPPMPSPSSCGGRGWGRGWGRGLGQGSTSVETKWMVFSKNSCPLPPLYSAPLPISAPPPAVTSYLCPVPSTYFLLLLRGDHGPSPEGAWGRGLRGAGQQGGDDVTKGWGQGPRHCRGRDLRHSPLLGLGVVGPGRGGRSQDGHQATPFTQDTPLPRPRPLPLTPPPLTRLLQGVCEVEVAAIVACGGRV